MVNGKHAIITGGANGIGKQTAITFAKNGARVVIWDLDEDRGAGLVSEAKEHNQDISFYKVDITDYASVSKAFEQLIEDIGWVDILINNAGITSDASLLKMSVEQWDKVVAVNLTGVFNCTKVAAAHMKSRAYGRIINASSVVGIYGNFGQTNYVATKSGVIGMSKVWAREFGKYGITVNAVAPGFIKTEMINTVPESVIDNMIARSAVKRLGKVQDISNAYLFLASDMASFITGTVLSVDGGLVI